MEGCSVELVGNRRSGTQPPVAPSKASLLLHPSRACEVGVALPQRATNHEVNHGSRRSSMLAMTGTFVKVESAMFYYVPWKSFNCLPYSTASGRESANLCTTRRKLTAVRCGTAQKKGDRMHWDIYIYWSAKTHDEHWWTKNSESRSISLKIK